MPFFPTHEVSPKMIVVKDPEQVVLGDKVGYRDISLHHLLAELLFVGAAKIPLIFSQRQRLLVSRGIWPTHDETWLC